MKKLNYLIAMEKLLHYVWKYKLFPEQLKTSDGQIIEVIDVGKQNTDAGPDFFNAKLKIDDKIWAGNIEIHTKASDWYAHQHHLDKGYNSVILHVVHLLNDKALNEFGQPVPQCEIKIPPRIFQNYEYLLAVEHRLPCSGYIGHLPQIHLKSWIESLLVERLERKSEHIFALLKRFDNSWDDVFYVLLSRNMGFGLNSEPFERLALVTPLQVLRKHNDNILQIEALLFGQAGLLSPSSDGTDDYFFRLQKEYLFFQSKYNLSPLNSFFFKKLRVRPSGSPFVRIAQLSVLCQRIQGLFSYILEESDILRIRLKFHVNASEYWQTHYSFKDESARKNKYLGDASLNAILINTVVPLLFAYGLKTCSEKYMEKAVLILESLRPEYNAIVRAFREAGLALSTACDSQALIQLMNEYCEKKKCLFCRIGYRMLNEK